MSASEPPHARGRRVCVLLGAAAVCQLLLLPVARALSYTSGPLDFITEGASLWGPGSAYRFDATKFIGTTWNVHDSIDAIIGNENEQVPGTGGSVPNPLRAGYDIARAACNLLPTAFNIRSNCISGLGTRPAATIANPIPSQFIDTRTGAAVDFTTSGKAGFNVGARIDSGSVDAQLAYSASIVVPDALTAGQRFRLDALVSNGARGFTTNSGEVEFQAEAVLGARATITGTGCAFSFGCSSASLPIGFDDQTLELVKFADTDGTGAKISILGALEPAAFNFGNPIQLPPGNPLLDFGDVTVYVPHVETTSTDGASGLVASGRSDFLALNADLDGLILNAFGLPPLLGTGVSVGVLSASYDLIDIGFGPVLTLDQDFSLDAALMVTLDFDRPVLIDGNSVSRHATRLDALGRFEFQLIDGQPVKVLPSFWVDGAFRNQTTFGVDGQFRLDVLQASLGIEYAGLSFDVGSVGPLYSLGDDGRFAIASFPPLYDQTFTLDGFNTIVGDSFVLGLAAAPGASGNEYAAQLVTGSPVAIMQSVENPGSSPFTIAFDYLFATGSGSLSIWLDGQLLDTLLAGGGTPGTMFNHYEMSFDPALFGFGATPFLDLQFLFDDLIAGSRLLLDNVLYRIGNGNNGLFNADFERGDLGGWLVTAGAGTAGTVATLTTVRNPQLPVLLATGLLLFGLNRCWRPRGATSPMALAAA